MPTGILIGAGVVAAVLLTVFIVVQERRRRRRKLWRSKRPIHVQISDNGRSDDVFRER